jgi:hypothetical protein
LWTEWCRLSARRLARRGRARYPVPDPALAKFGHPTRGPHKASPWQGSPQRKEEEEKTRNPSTQIVASTQSFCLFVLVRLVATFMAEAEENTTPAVIISAFRIDLDHLILSVIQPISIKSCHILLVQRPSRTSQGTQRTTPHHRHKSDSSRFQRGPHNLAEKRTRFKSAPSSSMASYYPQRTRLTHATPLGRYPCMHARHLSRQ